MKQLTLLSAILSAFAVSAVSMAQEPSPREADAKDPHIRYIGRFDMRDPAGPRANWPASAVEVRFNDQPAGTETSTLPRSGV